MAAGRSADEPFWDNYRDIQIPGLNGAGVVAHPRVHAHTCCLLTLKAPDTYGDGSPPPPPPHKRFHHSLIALIILLIQISAGFIRIGHKCIS